MNKNTTKLILKKETLRDLSATNAGEVKGGGGNTKNKNCLSVMICETKLVCTHGCGSTKKCITRGC